MNSIVIGFNTTLTAKVISWWSVTHVSWLSHTSTYTTFFPRPQTTFSHGSEVRVVNTPERMFASNSQPPGHESDTLTTCG